MSEPLSAEDFVAGILQHADRVRVYDPQKSREYYLRTRKLKGRKKGTGVQEGAVPLGQPNPTKVQRRQKIDMAATRASKGVSPEKAAKITALSDKAKQELTKISKDLEAWSADFKKRATNQSEKIVRETREKIEALPLLPRNASPALREQRAKRVAKMRADGEIAKAQLKTENRKAVEKKRLEVQGSKKQVVDNLRSAVRKVANTTYDQAEAVTLNNGTGR